ncbi:SART-1 protein [Sistotremastrum suecicum HHB10207 ss-3]|uniref:SART-1 protein n=1 Tax=Sistotremastrum suecicum HHB10207 ss-3 TaxID=1314776 RepID=A0A166EW19_9AGAM|nr:SART-1 protein [Sistotremastrum suecicum HHB10207 ss-3]
MEESISLEETNKIRISLGLKPLTDDKAPSGDKDKEAADNYAKQREREAKERDTKRIVDRIAKVKNKRELNASLTGATLADPDADVDDAMKWIRKSKKREKELARKRQEELENMDKAFQEEYGEKDLVGLKVSHDFEDLDEGEARILTLKDSRILDNEEDELQNIDMAEDEKTRKNNELKTKKRDYTGYDDDEFVPGHQGLKRAVLSKYDEDIDGTKETGFRLGAGVTKSDHKDIKMDEEQTIAVNRSLLSIDYSKNQEMSDYVREGDVGFKKPKTKKKRQNRRALTEADLGIPDEDKPTDSPMDIDEKASSKPLRDLDANFVDDDELQAALARERRAKMKKVRSVNNLNPEDIARKIAEEREKETSEANGIKKEEEQVADLGDAPSEGLLFDDTSEFVRSIAYDPQVIKIQIPTANKSLKPEDSTDARMESDDSDDEMEVGEVANDDEAVLMAIENAMNVDAAPVKEEDIPVGTSSEQTFGSGMASTLNILRQQGVLHEASAEERERERVQRERDRWLAEHRANLARRELEKMRSRGTNKDQSTREYENRVREQQEIRETVETFKDYKPDVNIVYHDEFGRVLTPKEAWKALSHRFHGKGSGKAKTEKRLKRIAEEKKKEAMASGDTPLSMNRAFQIRQEKAGQAHMVLSVGNRGAVPQVAEFLETPTLSKGKTEKRSKKKEAKNAAARAGDGAGLTTLPTVGVVGLQPATGAVVSAPPTTSSPGPSMMKSSFSRVAAEPVSGSASPATGLNEHAKFSMGLKRKANDDGGAASKKRS